MYTTCYYMYILALITRQFYHLNAHRLSLSYKMADSNGYTRTHMTRVYMYIHTVDVYMYTHLEHLTILCLWTRDVRQLDMSCGKLVTLRQYEIKYCM